jgi:hypothetical protein
LIKDIKVGDITDPRNRRHIIIGMNSTLDDVIGIGVPYANKLRASLVNPLTLGHVLSFRYDEGRRLHMIICHNIGFGGWKNADQHVRFGMDYLNQTEGETGEFSIVQIGTGKIGKRDGADHVAIRTAIATSFLPVTLFVRGESMMLPAVLAEPPHHMEAYAVWAPECGRQNISVA